jgi:transcriptional regulator with XRE-family HTH domain
MNRAHDIGLRLREAKRKKRYSQLEIATKSGVDQSQISRFIAGHFQRETPNLKRVCKALGVHLASAGPTPKNEAFSRTLAKELEGLWDGTHRHRRIIMRVVRALK